MQSIARTPAASGSPLALAEPVQASLPAAAARALVEDPFLRVGSAATLRCWLIPARARMRRAAIDTAARYSVRSAALSELLLFEQHLEEAS